MAEGRAGALGDYSTVAFSAGGVKQEISLEDWKGGWAAIVGGLNGKPTSQQFNMVTYILSALLNQAISDLSTVKMTANSALPKNSFTAAQIVALLSAFGLMRGCNADMLDGNMAMNMRLQTISILQTTLKSEHCPSNEVEHMPLPLLRRVQILAQCRQPAVRSLVMFTLQTEPRIMFCQQETRILNL